MDTKNILNERAKALRTVAEMLGSSAEYNTLNHVLLDAAETLEHVDRLINAPIIDDFFDAVRREAAHQQLKHGADHDAGKKPTDWYWLIGYLSGKSCNYFAAREVYAEFGLRDRMQRTEEKGVHHIVTTAAACLNWHRHARNELTAMRPGTEQPA